MDNFQNSTLIEFLKGQCELYFVNNFKQNKFIYAYHIPIEYFGKEYTIELTKESLSFDWLGEAKLESITEDNDNLHKHYKFEQSCIIKYKFKFNSVLNESEYTNNVHFHNEIFEPFENECNVKVEIDDLKVFDELVKLRAGIKRRYTIESIKECYYENDIAINDLFRQTLSKRRVNAPKYSDISTQFFYHEFFHCLWEIEECLITALVHHNYTSDFLGNKRTLNNRDFYIPNFNYNDSQYLLMIGFGFDRLYSFWDRIAFLLWNYEPLTNIAESNISFDKYFNKIQNSALFSCNSKSLKWLKKFHTHYYATFTIYRHKAVHFQMTNDWQGLLSSRFSSNAFINISDEAELKKLKLEFQGLGNLLLLHFNFCKQGFIEALKLIDELQ